MINSKYTLEVCVKSGNPVFVATIKCPILVGVYFFNSLKEANDYIKKENARLECHGYTLKYDCDGVTDEKFITVIMEVLNNDDIAIGSNGRTYSKTMFQD